MEDKKKALEVLENAVAAVNQAMEAIDNYAEEHGIAQRKSIMLDDLVHMVAKDVDVCSRCTGKVLYAAITFLRKNNMAVAIPNDDEEEDEDDE